jgi:uncharacterized repeat protein (TIGR01451 family)
MRRSPGDGWRSRAGRKNRPFLEFLEFRLAPAVFNVTSLVDSFAAGSGSLRRAIAESDMTPGGSNEIDILTPGTYRLTISSGVSDANDDSAGDLDFFNLKPESVSLVNKSGGTVVIDASGLADPDRAFDIGNFLPGGSAIQVSISGMTIQGGNATTGSGGGIRVSGGCSLTLDNDIVQKNHADASGGGISALNSNVTLSATIVKNNTSGTGGGIATAGSGSLLIRDTIIGNNISSSNSGGLGGGGILLAGTGTVTIAGSEITHNSAAEDGGGLLDTGDAKLTISSSTFDVNSAGRNGGALNLQTTVASTLTNVTVSGNGANVGGGLFYAAGYGSIALVNDTIVLNGANTTVGGVFASSANGSLKFTNTVVAWNEVTSYFFAPSDVFNNAIASDMVDSSHNFIGTNLGASDSFHTGHTPGSPNASGSLIGNASAAGGILLNPLLAPLADNGGTSSLPDGSHVLTHMDLADYGDNGVRDRGSDAGIPATDARGLPRLIDAHTDIGAVEYQDFDVSVAAVAPDSTVRAGVPASFALIVTNHGPNASQLVQINDTLPAGATIVSLSLNGSELPATAFTVNGHIVSILASSLTSGSSETYSLNVIAAAAGAFSTTATVSAPDDFDAMNNTSTATVVVQPQAVPVTGLADVTALVQVVRMSRPGKRLVFRITDTSQIPIQGPAEVVLPALPNGLKLRNASGKTKSGQKFVRVTFGADNILDPGETVMVPLVFSRRFNPRQFRVLAGPLA